MNAWYVAAVGLCLCAACGRATDATPAAKPAASAGSGGSGPKACDSAAPVPPEHRASAEECPTARGTIGPVDASACADKSGLACTSDADCTAGKDGRCAWNGDTCHTVCSYDDCLHDTDCPGKVPCACRSSATDMAANYCVVGSSCTTDADCGACGFCSLSVVPTFEDCSAEVDAGTGCTCSGITSEAYACHTPNDECTSNADCPGSTSYCSYSEAETRWICNVCPPRPIHP
jgi:hypothetical protein